MGTIAKQYLMMASIFASMAEKMGSFTRSFNREKRGNNYRKTSSSNFLRGKHTPKYSKKDLQRSHFGNFSPINK